MQKYVEDRGYQYRRLAYQGWRPVSSDYATGTIYPDLDWAREGVEGLGCVWLNIGWYKYDHSKDEYNRIGGHWITLVGYGHDGKRNNPRYLIVQDSASPSAKTHGRLYILPEQIGGGTLTGKHKTLPIDAAGLYKMGKVLHIRQGADRAILDGIVVLEMAPDEPGVSPKTERKATKGQSSPLDGKDD